MKRIEIDVVNPHDENNALLAWAARVDAGEKVGRAQPRLTFSSFDQLHSALTDKRMALLDYVATHEGLSIRQLAVGLNRDYKNVYGDVKKFLSIGLLEQSLENGVSAPFDDIVIHKILRRAA